MLAIRGQVNYYTSKNNFTKRKIEVFLIPKASFHIFSPFYHLSSNLYMFFRDFCKAVLAFNRIPGKVLKLFATTRRLGLSSKPLETLEKTSSKKPASGQPTSKQHEQPPKQHELESNHAVMCVPLKTGTTNWQKFLLAVMRNTVRS